MYKVLTLICTLLFCVVDFTQAGDQAALERELDEQLKAVRIALGKVSERIDTAQTHVKVTAQERAQVDERQKTVTAAFNVMQQKVSEMEREMTEMGKAMRQKVSEMEREMAEMGKEVVKMDSLQKLTQRALENGTKAMQKAMEQLSAMQKS